MLELRNLTKTYGSNVVLDNVSIKINRGELVALLGPSGAGKTTIIKLIGGFIESDSGEILIDGDNVTNVPSYRRNIGVVFQDYALFPHMTVEQNVAFGLKMRNIPEKEIKARVEGALQLVGLAGINKRYPNQLSGGQQQRVALARAIVIQPKLLLLDEPLSNLDAKLRTQVRRDICELQEKLNITTLLVTHDQEEAMTMGKRLAILNRGKIQQVGTPLEVYTEPINLFVAGFLGTPTMNFIECTIRGTNSSIVIQIDERSLVLPNERAEKGLRMNLTEPRPAILGIRPEDVCVSPIKHGPDILNGRIVAIEHLGSETLVYIAYRDRRLCCRAAPDTELELNDDVGFSLNLTKACLFDKVTGHRMF